MDPVFRFVHWSFRRLAWMKQITLNSQRRHRRHGVVLDRTDILAALQTLSRTGPPKLMMHSSLSSCGQIVGGAPAVLNTMRDWMHSGSLVLPTHSYCYQNREGPPVVFDRTQTTSQVGAITETFWRQPGVLRSHHPTHSLAAEGAHAKDLCDGFEVRDTPCGQGTPYEQLALNDTAVLMFGVTLNSYTLFHTAEDAARVPYLYQRAKMTLRWRGMDGHESSCESLVHNMAFERRFAEMDNWLQQRGLLRRVRLGLGDLLYIPSATEAHIAIVAELERDPWFLVAESSHPKSKP